MLTRPLALALPCLLAACAFDGSGTAPASALASSDSCRELVGVADLQAQPGVHLWRVGRDDAHVVWDQPTEPLALSPDGSRVAFGRPFAVHVVDLASGARTVIPVDGTPRSIAWRSKNPSALVDGVASHAIASIDPVRAEARVLIASADPLDDAELDPAGDGAGVLRGGQLWYVPVGDTPYRLTFEPDLLRFAGWSPDGTRVAFVARAGGDENLDILDLRTGGVLVVQSARHIRSPRWAPTGDRIAFVADRPASTGAAGEHLLVASGDGRDLRVLARTDGIDDLAWSAVPDELSWLAPGPDGATVNVADVRSGAPRVIAEGDWHQARVLGRCDGII